MIRFIALSLLTLLFTGISAQEEEHRKSIIIAAIPQHILNNTLHFEIDIPGSSPESWMVIAPQFYYRSESFVDAFDHPEYKTLIGAGIEIQNRRYLSPEEHGMGFYFSYGGGYRFLQINTNDHLWQNTTDDGLDWIRHTPQNYDINIHGLMVKGLAGYQMTFFDHLIGDAYIGFGIRYAIEDKPDGSYLKFNYGVNDYAYRGMLLVGGIRMGVGW